MNMFWLSYVVPSTSSITTIIAIIMGKVDVEARRLPPSHSSYTLLGYSRGKITSTWCLTFWKRCNNHCLKRHELVWLQTFSTVLVTTVDIGMRIGSLVVPWTGGVVMSNGPLTTNFGDEELA